MAIAPHTGHPNDLEAPSTNEHGAPRKMFRNREFEDDVGDSQRRKRQTRSRLSACILGVVTLAAVAFAAYYFLIKDGIDLQKGNYQHKNFQGSVAMSAIEMHATTGDCWLAIHSNVYDMTDYAPLHPGPDSLITDHCGTDATAAYTSMHSQALLPTVSEYLLGALQGADDGSATPPNSSNESPSSGGSTAEGSQIALATMQMHGTAGDCWLAYYGIVYDMTQYAPNHPASSSLITNHCGTDATNAYASAHSRSLLTTVARYRLGALEGTDTSAFPPATNNPPSDSSED
ncbi:unnamed protein product [Cylindrotheca closterium]|uniref:Cytochrome b5 heme-binding domain-containing protein n=1 Tax=Cylindrotheca closterium TaxID=2856 RepID=A0AAD2CME9_9STRA|nr:unnamed protein product [Cylindrotheca closterium]